MPYLRIPDLERALRVTVLLIIAGVLGACSQAQQTAEPESAAPELPGPAVTMVSTDTLVVALYPYVPRLSQFKMTLRSQWQAVHPNSVLVFVSDVDSLSWDGGYDDDPPQRVDVFAFDAVFLNYFIANKFLDPLAPDEVSGLDDFFDYAITEMKRDNQYYAIPQLGCANILFYRTGTALDTVRTLTGLTETVKKCTYTSQIPPDERGMMLNLAGGTTSAAFYLDAVTSQTGAYPPPLPWNVREIDLEALTNIRTLLATASFSNATRRTGSYQRATWFDQGYGEGYVGYTESMSVLHKSTRDSIQFRVLPLSDNERSSLFFADVVGVNPTTRQRGTRDLAVELANVMTSSKTMVQSIGAAADEPYPQYLMATRPSVFDTLDDKFPIYTRMKALVTDNDPRLFALNDSSRVWFDRMKSPIRSEIRAEYPCGCDQIAASYIMDAEQAAEVCPETCASYGGWNKQWTNRPPAAPSGRSVCGCLSCETTRTTR